MTQCGGMHASAPLPQDRANSKVRSFKKFSTDIRNMQYKKRASRCGPLVEGNSAANAGMEL